MVQRLCLMGILSPEEYPMGIKSLEAISGMQPRSFEVERQVWEPKYRYKAGPAGQASQIEQYRLFKVQRSGATYIEAREVPEAGRNIKVISQSVLSTEIQSGIDDADTFLKDLGYEHKSTSFLKGIEFVLKKYVVVQLFKLYDANGTLLDPSNQDIVEAAVDVDAVTDLNSVERATQLLLNVQQELKGIIALKVPNRGVFNTRLPRVQ